MTSILRFFEKYTLLLLVGLVILSPAVVYARGIPDNPNLEKRALAPEPDLFNRNLDLSDTLPVAPEQIESRVKDKFPLRNKIIQLTNFARYKFLRVNPTHNVREGQDGFFFYTDDANQRLTRGELFDDEELTRWTSELQKRHEYARARGIAYYVFISPIKDTLYPEKLPADYPELADYRRSEQLVTALRETTDVEVVYLRDPLEEALRQNPDQRLYQKTDSHWNSHGSFLAYTEIMETLEKDFPKLTPYARTDFEITTNPDIVGDFAYHMGVGDFLSEPDYPVYTFTRYQNPYVESAPEFHQVSIPELTEPVPYQLAKANTITPGPRVLMLHSSYMDLMRQFFNLHFEETTYYKLPINFDTEIVAAQDPEIIIQEFSEQSLFDVPYSNLPADVD